MSSSSSYRLNDSLIEIMEQLSSIMQKQGEPFRAKAYQKAQETIMNFPNDIYDVEVLKGQPGIGDTIMEKCKEFASTGTLKILEREKTNPINILAEVYGIGPKKAKELVDAGITNIDDLRKFQDTHLNDVQKIGLKYYEDILKRIPRSEIVLYEKVFQKVFEKVDFSDTFSNSEFSIVGSYRRGASTSGDIDVIITSKNADVFIRFIDVLIQEKIIVEVLSRGSTKCLVIGTLPSSSTSSTSRFAYRRIDFLYAVKEEYPFSLLYFTGSKIFNTVMRHQALSLGFTMNEHGLYKMIEKKKGEKVDKIFLEEKDIFDYLNMEYKAPNERIDGSAVIRKNTDSINLVNMTLKPKKIGSIPSKKNVSKKNIFKNEVIKNEVIKNEVIKNEIKNLFIPILHDFQKNGISILKKLKEDELNLLLKEANHAYHNKTPIMTDNEFDILKEFVLDRYPMSVEATKVGAPILSIKNKVVLPYEMPSMDKIKPDTNALTLWKEKFQGDYVVSCKLDGVSALYCFQQNNVRKLYTRGDGKIGQDISHLIPYLRIPIPKIESCVIRGELVMTKKVFEEKYKDTFANPRNLVAGIINHKHVDKKAADLSFVAYEVVAPVLKPSEQMNFLKSLDIVECVSYQLETRNSLTNDFLSSLLKEWRLNCNYEIDGLIVTNNQVYSRKTGNPEHSFAFKMVLSEQIAEAKVVDVLWTPSKDGYLKPRVQIVPIYLGGVKIEYATGFNAAFIESNKIGIGAIIELIRSGDVIPYIKKVIVPATTAKMPLSSLYVWNETHVDILLKDIGDDETVREKNITGFFKGIGVEGLSSGNVLRLINAGFTSVEAILSLNIQDFLKVEGFQTKLATKIYEGIRNALEKASLVQIMSASNIFGRGFSEKKLELILEGVPDIIKSKDSLEKKVELVKNIKGMAEKTAIAFVTKIPDFIAFLENCGPGPDLYSKKIMENVNVLLKDTLHPLFGKTIVITGFRDAIFQETLLTLGAKIGSNISKNTFVLIIKDSNSSVLEKTGKIMDAENLGIPIMNISKFKEKYLNL